jgi:hypothetical protein
MVREITIIKLKSEVRDEAIQLFKHYTDFKRTRPGCRTAGVNTMVMDPSLPYLDHHAVLLYAEYDDLKCLAECTHALQEHFNLHQFPFQEFMIGPPIYGIFEA